MKKTFFLTFFGCLYAISIWATTIHIDDPQTWSVVSLAAYVDQTVSFDVPMFLINSYGTRLSPSCVAAINDANVVSVSGVPHCYRIRSYSDDVVARVKQSGDSYYLQYVSGSFLGNTRQDLLQGPNMDQIDARGKHSVLVCAANLEYYLVNNVGTGYGPATKAEHAEQRAKTKQALALINADIYGLCEIEQGTAALQEVCTDMNYAHSDRHYCYVNNHTSSAAGSYTMSAFVYDSLVVRPIGECKKINTEVLNRKYMQCFQELSTGETFIFSMNHFKAMTGSTDTESRRIAEARAVNSNYDTYKMYCGEEDLLIMGDLNCYYGSEPISILLQDGQRTDLHRYFHPEGSYSYQYAAQVNYLDHAIVNSTLLPQVTGMLAYHVNSDESDCYTYDGSCNDGTMFRYSDHDPVLVGLKLNSTMIDGLMVLNYGSNLNVRNGEGGYIRIYDMNGAPIQTIQGVDMLQIDGDDVSFPIEEQRMMTPGVYIVHIYYNGQVFVKKYIRP